MPRRGRLRAESSPPAPLATDLADEIERVDYGKAPDPEKLARLWTATRDARNYVILGDPAVRMAASLAP